MLQNSPTKFAACFRFFLLITCWAAPILLGVRDLSAQLTVIVNLDPGPTATWLMTPAGSGQHHPDFDSVVEIQLLDSGGNPVVGFPGADITLAPCDPGSNLLLCAGGLVADGNTDALGRTTISGPPSGGGFTEQVRVVVAGTPLAPCFDLRINSPDLNGDLQVTVSDLGPWATDANSAMSSGGALTFRSDLYPDGDFDMLDMVLMARHLLEVCP